MPLVGEGGNQETITERGDLTTTLTSLGGLGTAKQDGRGDLLHLTIPSRRIIIFFNGKVNMYQF